MLVVNRVEADAVDPIALGSWQGEVGRRGERWHSLSLTPPSWSHSFESELYCFLISPRGGTIWHFLAIALERSGIDASQLDIAEPRELLGEGLAYQTRDLHHRFNVPTGRLSSLEELPDDFVEWSNAASYSFMERRTYSGYLRERLGQGHNHIRAWVTDMELESDGVVRATFDTGEPKDYVAVVLAMGHGKALTPDFLRGIPESSRIIKDVWDGSPLPERHVQFQITPFTPTINEVATLAKLRTYFLDAGDKWREAVDGLRPIMDAMWRGFTKAEREEFLRTDGSTWFRRRHRIAPDVATGLLQRTDGTAYPQIFAIGPLRSGQVFETTAIPEIRKQATAIAERIVANSNGLKV